MTSCWVYSVRKLGCLDGGNIARFVMLLVMTVDPCKFQSRFDMEILFQCFRRMEDGTCMGF